MLTTQNRNARPRHPTQSRLARSIRYITRASSGTTFLHGVETTEITSGTASIIEVASSIIAITGTAAIAAPGEMIVVRNMDDVTASIGPGSIYDALRRVYQYVTNTTVICLPLGKDGDFTEPTTPTQSGVTVSSADFTLYNSAGTGIFSPEWVLSNPNGLPLTVVSGDDDILIINDDNQPVPVADGNTTITVTVDGGENYTSDVITLTVKVQDETDIPADMTPSQAYFSASASTLYTAQPGKAVALTNPDGQSVSWSSSDEDVAFVDALTGEVTPRTAGEFILTASLAATSSVMPVDITCLVTVEDAPADELLAAFIASLPTWRKARQLFGFSPKVFMAPGIIHRTGALGPAISTAKQLRGIWLVDMPLSVTTPEAAYQWKKTNASEQRALVDWPRVAIINEEGTTQYDWVAPSMAGLICQVDKGLTDAGFETGYWCSPSNYPLADVVGVEHVLEYIPNDRDCEVNYLNSQGIATIINNLGGFRAFGNRSGAFPDATDPLTFISWRRVCDIIEDSIEYFTLYYMDRPMFTRPEDITSSVIGMINDSVNEFLRSKTGTALVYGKCEIRADENTAETLRQGIIYYHYKLTPPVPMEHVVYTSEVYVDGLEDAFRQLLGS
ncbi:phage tail sheath family protein [Citrobacter braakii]|uniref:phage tail sheath family protein n=1 Tax=Citrobacter braakii TaxID=57706 RepID=UPI00403A0B40